MTGKKNDPMDGVDYNTEKYSDGRGWRYGLELSDDEIELIYNAAGYIDVDATNDAEARRAGFIDFDDQRRI
jgi:hypothetical protein